MTRNIEDYGNKLEISGFLLSNAEQSDLILLPEAKVAQDLTLVQPTQEQLLKIFYQLDTLEITNSQKVVLRKSQRQIDQNVSWNVFRRDGYRCVYCGNDHTPLTVDHLMTWEEGGDTIEDNLVSACRKCNKTRGNKTVPEFFETPYYQSLNDPNRHYADVLLGMYNHALTLLKRKARAR